MTEEEFYIEQLLMLQQSYQKDAEAIINRLVAIRQRQIHPMFVFMDMAQNSDFTARFVVDMNVNGGGKP